MIHFCQIRVQKNSLKFKIDCNQQFFNLEQLQPWIIDIETISWTTEELKFSGFPGSPRKPFTFAWCIYSSLKLPDVITSIELSDDLKTQLVHGAVICAISSLCSRHTLVLEDLKLIFFLIYLSSLNSLFFLYNFEMRMYKNKLKLSRGAVESWGKSNQQKYKNKKQTLKTIKCVFVFQFFLVSFQTHIIF